MTCGEGANTGAILFSGSSRPKSGVRFCSAGRRGQNRGSDFVQRIVAAKIGGANLFSGLSRRKSGVRFCPADRRGQNRGCDFVQRIVAAKIAGANLFSGVSLVGAHKHTPLKTLPASWPGFFGGGRSPTSFSSLDGRKGSKPSTEGGEVCLVHDRHWRGA